MSLPKGEQRTRFWMIVGITLAGDLLLTFLYTILGPGFSGRVWSDALCTSAVLLGTGSAVPFLFDAGRGLSIASKMGSRGDDRQQSWQEERRRREKGMLVTFALALAAVLIGLTSLIAALW